MRTRKNKNPYHVISLREKYFIRIVYAASRFLLQQIRRARWKSFLREVTRGGEYQKKKKQPEA